jgi:glycosyltransferase involved in cell wall biosynthesis
MKSPTFFNSINTVLSWVSCGPALLTNHLNTGKYNDFCVYPSYYFLPIHHTGIIYEGHKKTYAHQLWCTNFQLYSSEKYQTVLPEILLEQKYWVSVLVSSYNTEPFYIKECLDSILLQDGNFGIELVWINDGSDLYYTVSLKEKLKEFENKSRFCKIVYHENDKNRGTCFTLNKGVLLCSNELIIKMDSDDIMKPSRINTQIQFMKNNVDIPFCSANITLFNNPNYDFNKKEIINTTKHNEFVTWKDFLKEMPEWFSNHCCMCFRKNAVLSVGNYNINREPQSMMEDYELQLNLLKKYGKMCNIQEVLLYYRIHIEQLTSINKSGSSSMIELRKQIIYDCIYNI